MYGNEIMRCLIIDNYDSFTWNLADYITQIYGREPVVVYNDQYSWSQIRRMEEYHSIILSPGPGSVTNEADFGVCRQALEESDIPVLGVCLGMQGLAYVHGGRIVHAPVPFHGRRSRIRHDDSELFQQIPSEFEAVRYHSLMVAADSIPACLAVTARTDSNLVMGLRHTSYPHWGLQFHPESILSEYGKRLIANFRKLAEDFWIRRASASSGAMSGTARRTSLPVAARARDVVTAAVAAEGSAPAMLQVFSRRLPDSVDAESAFLRLYAGQENCFWLDSQCVREGMSRMSFMGSVDDADVLTHRVTSGPGANGVCGREFFDTLAQRLNVSTAAPEEPLPFEFRGGYVGFMTYEMKATLGEATSHRNIIPDAVWMRADRFLAIDHVTGAGWLVAVAGESAREAALHWMEETSARLKVQPSSRPRAYGVGVDPAAGALKMDNMTVRMQFGREGYLELIERCRKKIIDGESYEICLTNQFCTDVELDPVRLYCVLRKENAAPFGGFIRTGRFCVLSTSPERFLKVQADGSVQTKPIKGTCARAKDARVDHENAVRLAGSEKDQAENLMIVDLMRNDLGRISVPGSIGVSKLMGIESYETVHQMVSTVESKLRAECTLVDALRAVYPGGSISGAPKKRTLEIIDELEATSRGIYCGTLGYLGYNRLADLNVAIRTLSYDGQTLKFGAGGAVTYLSDPNAEFEEVLLKAESVLRPIWHYLASPEAAFEYTLAGNRLLFSRQRNDEEGAMTSEETTGVHA